MYSESMAMEANPEELAPTLEKQQEISLAETAPASAKEKPPVDLPPFQDKAPRVASQGKAQKPRKKTERRPSRSQT